MDLEEIFEFVIITILLYEAMECLDVIGRGRRFWVRPLYQTRDIDGFFAANFEIMYNSDSEQFKKSVRMSKDVFDVLFSLVELRLTKTSRRPSISAKCRLFLTLVYLAHGGSTQMFSSAFKMGRTTVAKIVSETCDVLWDTLGFVYLSVPNKHEWKRIATDFNEMWNFPNCVGAVDGKHITITCPPNSGSQFFNYKGTYSIVFLAACDANYTFTAIDIGAYGSQSDGGVLWNSSFGQKLLNGQLDLPEDDVLPDTNIRFPYFMVGDAAFSLKRCLMRPYPGTHLPPEKEMFNKRLSRARRVIENAFGILVARWRILLSPLQMHPASAEKIVKATVLLHNFLKMHNGTYCPPDYVDQYQGDNIINGLWRNEISAPLRNHGRMTSNNAPRDAFKLRDDLMEHIFSHPLQTFEKATLKKGFNLNTLFSSVNFSFRRALKVESCPTLCVALTVAQRMGQRS